MWLITHYELEAMRSRVITLELLAMITFQVWRILSRQHFRLVHPRITGVGTSWKAWYKATGKRAGNVFSCSDGARQANWSRNLLKACCNGQSLSKAADTCRCERFLRPWESQQNFENCVKNFKLYPNMGAPRPSTRTSIVAWALVLNYHQAIQASSLKVHMFTIRKFIYSY